MSNFSWVKAGGRGASRRAGCSELHKRTWLPENDRQKDKRENVIVKRKRVATWRVTWRMKCGRVVSQSYPYRGEQLARAFAATVPGSYVELVKS